MTVAAENQGEIPRRAFSHAASAFHFRPRPEATYATRGMVAPRTWHRLGWWHEGWPPAFLALAGIINLAPALCDKLRFATYCDEISFVNLAIVCASRHSAKLCLWSPLAIA